MEEIWRDIKGYEGLYKISNLGKVKNKNNEILKAEIIKNGYERVKLYKNETGKRILVHRIVAENFIENLDNKPFVNHKNGNRQDNRVYNLEWVTSKENAIHGFYEGNIEMPETRHKKKIVQQYDLNNNLIKEWNGLRNVADKLKINAGKISECCNGKIKTYKGYIWKYKKL